MKNKTPFKAEGEKLGQAMVMARMSEKEVAHRFGKSRARVREMLKGERRPDEYLIQQLKEQARV